MENNILVLYKSKYGATKKYVAMLKTRLSCDICNIENSGEVDLGKYRQVIFAAPIYAGGILGFKLLRKKYKNLPCKRLAILCVGASPYDPKALEELKARNLKNLPGDIPIFYARGAWNESRMDWKDRALCKMLQKAISKKTPEQCEPWMKALLGAAGQACDWTDYKYLSPLLDYITAEN